MPLSIKMTQRLHPGSAYEAISDISVFLSPFDPDQQDFFFRVTLQYQ